MTKLFPNNVHAVERGIRIVLGIGLLSLVFIGPRTLWGYVGLVPLLTGFVGDCPLYTVFGMSRSHSKTLCRVTSGPCFGSRAPLPTGTKMPRTSCKKRSWPHFAARAAIAGRLRREPGR
jgi:hypothetical protein